MLVVELIRWTIFLSFLLLLVEGVAGIIVFRRFVKGHVRGHAELDVRIERVETRLGIERNPKHP